MQDRSDVPPFVLIRDLAIFQVKLVVDGCKDAVVIPLSIMAAVADLAFGGSRRGRLFYGLMGACERFDRWLNLHKPALSAGRNQDGLFGESRAGDDTLLGRMEEMVRGAEPPLRPMRPARPAEAPRGRPERGA